MALQANEVSRLGITIETNPSSNLLIGSIDDLKRHPSFALKPIPSGSEGSNRFPVLISINDDDPITFATSLPDEYAHIMFALTRHGIPREATLRWLDDCRRNAWLSRFTLRLRDVPRIREEICNRLRIWAPSRGLRRTFS